MKRAILSSVLVLATFGLPAFAQVGQDLKAAGQDTKDAAKTGAHKTANGTKRAYRATKRGVKKGTHKVANATQRGAGKVADKTASSTNQ